MGKVAFTEPGIGRVFLGCASCGRVMPHYKVYGRVVEHIRDGMCVCGGGMFKVTRLPDWKAMWWVLVVGWFWRKTVKKEVEWDPRMPIRNAIYE